MYDVISIGAATVDIFVKSQEFNLRDNLLTLVRSSKNEISDGLICSGGGATNSSVSFSRLGLKSACVSLLGSDPLKEYILSDLTKNKVDTSFLITQKNSSTDWSVILVASDGSRSILTNRGDSCLQTKNIKWKNLEKTKWFYITSLEGNLDFLEKIIGFAKDFNIKISLNPGNRELRQGKTLNRLLKYVDFLLLNRTESEMITELSFDNPKFWDKLSSLGPPMIAVTNGREGAYLLLPNNTKYFSPSMNIKPVDETGAGDAFGSTFVAALIHGLEPKDALFWSVKNSASVVSCLGSKPGLLALKQINK